MSADCASTPDDPIMRLPQHMPSSTPPDGAETTVAARSPTDETSNARPRTLALLSAIACTVFGVKLIVIATLGSTMPLFDQWDGEAVKTYLPYLHGTYSIGDLFEPHNEHRIVFTRLLALIHLELAGEWNTHLEMIFCAVIHAFLVTWLCALLIPLVAPRRHMLFACFIVVVFTLPLGYENTLLGFNFHFYLTLLFGLAAIATFASAAPFTWRWFIGLAAAILSYLSFSSSGIAAIVTAAVLVTLQLVTKVRERCNREFLGVTVIALIGIGMLLWEISVVNASGTPSNVTPLGFLLGLLFLAGPTILGIIGIQGPAIWFCRNTMINRPPSHDRAWVAVGITAWVAIQLAIVAYGRGTAIGVRYMDMLLPVYPVAFVAVFLLADHISSDRLKRYARTGAVAWVFVTVVLITALGYYMAILQAIDWNKSARQQAINARAYMATHSRESLKVRDHSYLVDVTFPNLDEYARILDDADVRAIMPPEIRPVDADNMSARKHLLLEGALASATASSVRFVLGLGPALVALGVGLFFSLAARGTLYARGESQSLSAPGSRVESV